MYEHIAVMAANQERPPLQLNVQLRHAARRKLRFIDHLKDDNTRWTCDSAPCAGR